MYCQHCKMAGYEMENCRKLGNKDFCTHCRIAGHDVSVCRKLAAMSVNMMNDKLRDQSVNMATATISRSEPMPTMKVLVSPMVLVLVQ